MSSLAVAVIGGAVIGGAASVYAGKKSAEGQENAANTASNTELEMYYQGREDTAPWREAGEYALNKLTGGGQSGGTYEDYLSGFDTGGNEINFSDLSGLGGIIGTVKNAFSGVQNSGSSNQPLSREEWQAQQGTTGQDGGLLAGPGDFYESPSYQFNLGEGEKAIRRMSAARGLGNSGKEMKDTLRFSQGLASNEYQNFVNNWLNTKLNPTQSLAGVGQSSASNLGNVGQATAANMGNAQMSAGNARASGYINQSNAINQGLQGIGQAAGQYFGSQYQPQTSGTNATSYYNSGAVGSSGAGWTDPQWNPSWGLG